MQGQAGRTFYILLRGEVAVLESTFTAEGGEVSRREVNRLRAGACGCNSGGGRRHRGCCGAVGCNLRLLLL